MTTTDTPARTVKPVTPRTRYSALAIGAFGGMIAALLLGIDDIADGDRVGSRAGLALAVVAFVVAAVAGTVHGVRTRRRND